MAEATPIVLVPVVRVDDVEEGRLVMSTSTLKEREEGPAPLRELPLALVRGPGMFTTFNWDLSSELACINRSFLNSRSP